MMNIWSPQADQILSVGKSLKEVGVRNWALNLSQTLVALEKLRDEKIAILGGDVYQIENGILQPNYDSWHCDREKGEVNDFFVKRSFFYAKNYVSKYKPLFLKEFFFALVPAC